MAYPIIRPQVSCVYNKRNAWNVYSVKQSCTMLYPIKLQSLQAGYKLPSTIQPLSKPPSFFDCDEFASVESLNAIVYSVKYWENRSRRTETPQILASWISIR